MAFFLSSKSNKFIECRQPQQRFSSVENASDVRVCFLLSLPLPMRLLLLLLFFLYSTLCGIIFMRSKETNSHTILHSNNKQTPAYVYNSIDVKKVTSLSTFFFFFSAFWLLAYGCFCVECL